MVGFLERLLVASLGASAVPPAASPVVPPLPARAAGPVVPSPPAGATLPAEHQAVLSCPAFFDSIRASVFRGNLTESQVEGVNALLAVWEGHDRRWTAYALATAYHETDFTMQPIAEYGRGRGRPYGVACGPYGKVYYGRGYVQLTWLKNYQRADREMPGFDLVRNPDNALEPEVAAVIMLRGMTEAWFTGLALDDFFDANKTDWIGARRIINGTDCAAQIASYATKFYAALEAAK